jgi:predicted secreted protein
MSITLGIFTFLNAWWVCLFMALPFGREEGPKEALDYNAAPARFNWKKSFKIATVLAAVFTALLAIAIESELVPLRDML